MFLIPDGVGRKKLCTGSAGTAGTAGVKAGNTGLETSTGRGGDRVTDRIGVSTGKVGRVGRLGGVAGEVGIVGEGTLKVGIAGGGKGTAGRAP